LAARSQADPALTALRAELDHAVDAAVEQARNRRPKAVSWREIADAAGIGLSTAAERWARRLGV
jgi:hypothetical protein